MNKLLPRRLSAVLLVTVLLFTSVFSMSMLTNAATSFTPRLSAPDSSNKYYYSDINVFYKYGWGMPNCTAYACGRAYELLKSEPKLCWYSAEEWYDYNISNKCYSYGKTPKLGAIACWYYNGGGGHVAVVEKIENNTITFSNSAYSGENFYISTAKTSDSNAGGMSYWNFQGYIYILDDATTTYTTGIYKTNVTTTLNMRSGAGTSYEWLASIPNNVKLSVTKIKSADGYTWGYTSYDGNNGWVALDYCIYVSELPATQTTTAPATTVPTTAQVTTAPATTVPTTTPATTVPTTTPATTTPATTAPAGLGVGDVNYDGRIDILDATEIQKYLVELTQFTDEQIKFADFDFNGSVDVGDCTCMQKYLVMF